jgi:hypothetical protein
MVLGPDEPVAGPWRVERLDVFARSLVDAAGDPPSRPRILAVDGRSGSGKTTLANRLCQVLPGAAMVHTDDVAWAHSRFGWDDLMLEGILEPLHAGQDVHYQPPAWRPHGRSGYIDVSTDVSTVIIEGVGASRRQVAHLVDVAIWVQSDLAGARGRGVRRDIVDRASTRPSRCRTGTTGRPKRCLSCSRTGLGSELMSLLGQLRCWPTIPRSSW